MKGILDKRRKLALTKLSDTISIQIRDLSYWHQALTHTSFANESKQYNITHNERLEFLGDAVLDLVISDVLFRRFPGLLEGELTKARARLVCEGTLAVCAVKIGLGEYILLGKGEASSGGRNRNSILADAFEALIGAIYLDSGMQAATDFIMAQLSDELKFVERGEYVRDYKTLLQEIVQKKNENKINYEIIAEKGPDHEKIFEVAVNVNSTRMGTGTGKSKKEAEQQSARQALIALNVIQV